MKKQASQTPGDLDHEDIQQTNSKVETEVKRPDGKYYSQTKPIELIPLTLQTQKLTRSTLGSSAQLQGRGEA